MVVEDESPHKATTVGDGHRHIAMAEHFALEVTVEGESLSALLLDGVVPFSDHRDLHENDKSSNANQMRTKQSFVGLEIEMVGVVPGLKGEEQPSVVSALSPRGNERVLGHAPLLLHSKH